MTKDLGILSHLFADRSVVSHHDNAISAILEGRAEASIVCPLLWIVVGRTVDEDADAIQILALVMEVGLDRQVVLGAGLGKVREPETVLVEMLDELTLERRSRIDALDEPGIVIIIASAAAHWRAMRSRQPYQELFDHVPIQ